MREKALALLQAWALEEALAPPSPRVWARALRVAQVSSWATEWARASAWAWEALALPSGLAWEKALTLELGLA